MQKPFRMAPKMPAASYKTYQIASPVSTHTRPATCTEVDCEQQAHGWATVVDESTELGARQAEYVRGSCRPVQATLAADAGLIRRYVEARTPEGLTRFEFPAGQRCFREHRVPLDRPELYIVRDGDWRGNPRRTTPRRHTRPEYWVEDFHEHTDRLTQAIEKG